MKKLLTVTLMAGLLSIPSVVFAEADWYGSIRTGVLSGPHDDVEGNSTGVADFGSRWGIKGSAEAAEGLTAVYRYERKINSTDASDPGGRLSYVGLSGGFGTVTVGQVWGAGYNHFGAIVDQGLNFSSPGATGYRFGNALSYAVSIGNVSMQADAVMDQGTKKTGDAMNFGATINNIGETGKVAFAHRRHANLTQTAKNANATMKDVVVGKDSKKVSSSFIAGSYGIGDMTVFLGYSQDSKKDAKCTSTALANAVAAASCLAKGKTKTTYAGLHGGVGDTGVGYVVTVRSEKSDSSGFGQGDKANNAASTASSKMTPWTLGLSRSLGGGATLKFEHSNPGDKAKKASSALWLHVNF